MADDPERNAGLLAWQWSLYPAGHTTRANLILHILTVPVFELGTILILVSPWMGGSRVLVGLALMVSAMAAQGRGHAMEPQSPVRFRGPLDVIARIMAEQWIAFPRFVVTGGFARAWRITQVPRNPGS